MPHSAKALRMEELDLCLYLSCSHIRLFVFVIQTMYAYKPYLTPSFVMEVFLFFPGGEDSGGLFTTIYSKLNEN